MSVPLLSSTLAPIEYPVLPAEEIAALNAAVIAADAAAAAGLTRRREAEQRRSAIADRLAAMPQAPAENASAEEDMAAALAADPSMLPDPDAIAAATQERVAARRTREALMVEGNILRQAMAKIDGEIASINAELQTLGEERADKWQAFLTAAHPYLIDRFRRAFAVLVDETLTPLSDIQAMEIGGRRLVPSTAWRIESRTQFRLEREVPYTFGAGGPAPMTGSQTVTDALFELGYRRVDRTTAAIDAFRASLPAPKG